MSRKKVGPGVAPAQGSEPPGRTALPRPGGSEPASRSEGSGPFSGGLLGPGRGFPFAAFAFFVLFFLYVWLRIEPALEYQHSAPVFFMGRSFFRPVLGYPGGLVEYDAAFLAQLNYYNWLGALVFTAAGLLIFLAARGVLQRFRGVAPNLAPFVPPWLLLLLRERYDGASLSVGTGLLLALGPVLAYLRLPPTRPWLRLAACWLLAAVVCGVAGLWPCLLFVALAGLFEGRRRRNWPLGLGCALSAMVAPLAMVCFPDAEPARFLNPWGEVRPLLFAAAVYLFFPVAAVILAASPEASALLKSAVPVRTGSSGKVPRRRWLQTAGRQRAYAVGLFCLGWALVWLFLDGTGKRQAQIEYYSSRKDYAKVLAVAAGLKPMDPASEVRLHLALYHTGRLSEELFAYTNQTLGDLLPGLAAGLESCRAQSRTLFELGLVSDAEHLAQEALEWDGDRPDLLRLLAEVNVLKDRPNAARVFLNRLGQAPFQRDWADACLRELPADPRLTNDPALAQIRAQMVTNDLAHEGLPAGALLRHLLGHNPRNQMAFEYLMADYLVAGQVDKVVEGLGQLDAFGYTGVPRHYEEAVLLFQRLKGVEVVLHGRQLRPETIRRFQQFSQAMNRRAYESAEGRRALARDFGDTFWYHYYASQMAPKQPANRSAGP